MQAFFDYCTSRMKKTDSLARSDSPGIEVLYQCGNFACISETKCIAKWITAKYNGHFVYTCSEQCYFDWLDSPNTLGAWSPLKPFKHLKDPPPLTL